MADYEDLEDELGQMDNDPRNMDNQLFDDDDDDEDFQPDLAQPGDVDDDDGDAFAGPAGTRQAEPAAAKPAPEPAPAPTDLKAKLAALAQKKRQEAAAAEAGGGKKRKGDKDKDKDGKGKRKRDKSGKGEKERPARPTRTPGGEQPPPRKQRPNDEDGPQGSVDSRELQAEEADKGFIDDEADNFAPEDAPSDDEDARLANALEAVEEGHDLFGRKNKKKKQESDAQMTVAIDNMIAQMEAAADMDMDNHTNNKPAFSKLKMLKEVEGFVAQRKYHELFIHSGGLGVLKAWLEPYSDGTLPNVRVRSAVLNSCKILPIDTGREDIKENLKKSQLGSRIMFLANCPDETQANRKMAIELVQNWSRPIFFDAEAEAEKKRAREDALRRARAATIEQHRAKDEQKQAEQDAKNKIKYGQQGYRWHAVIPQPVKLDYVTAPQQESAVSQAAAGMQAGAKKDEDRFSKKMREVVRKQKGSTARGGVVSVEGRGMII